MNTIDKLKEHILYLRNYFLDINKLVDIKSSSFEKYGIPLKILEIDDSFIILFRKLINFESTLIKTDKSFKNVIILFKSDLVTDFVIDYENSCIYILESNLYDWLVNKKREKSIYDKRNRILKTDTDGRFIEDVLTSTEDNLFSTTIALSNYNELIYQDISKKQLILLNLLKKHKSCIDIGDRLIKRIKLSGDNQVLLISASKNNYYEINSVDDYESVYKINNNNKEITLLYKTNCIGIPYKQLYDIDVKGLDLICITSKSMEIYLRKYKNKINIHLNKNTLKWTNNLGCLTSINKSSKNANRFYLTSHGGNNIALYKLTLSN